MGKKKRGKEAENAEKMEILPTFNHARTKSARKMFLFDCTVWDCPRGERKKPLFSQALPVVRRSSKRSRRWRDHLRMVRKRSRRGVARRRRRTERRGADRGERSEPPLYLIISTLFRQGQFLGICAFFPNPNNFHGRLECF